MAAVTSGELLVERALQEYKEASETERKVEVEERLSHYQDDYRDLVYLALRKCFVKEPSVFMKPMIDDSINVFKYVINQQYNLYQEEPKREALVGTKPDDRFNEIQNSIQYDAIMDKAQKLAGAATGVALYVVPEKDTKSIRIDIVTPDHLTTIQDPTNPSEALAIIFEVNLEDSVFTSGTQLTGIAGSTGIGEEIRYFVYWDVFGNHMMFDSHLRKADIADNPENKNPFTDPDRPGRTLLPFVICTPSYVPGAIWDKTTGRNLMSSNTQIAVMGTLLNYYSKMQSFKQPYIKGNVKVNMTDEMLSDPSVIWQILGEGVEVGTLDMQNNIEAFQRVLDAKIERALNQEGLALADFKKTGSEATGYALKIKRIPLEEKRCEQEKFWKLYETELFELIRVVNNNQFPDKPINPTAEFVIEFGQQGILNSPAEQIQIDTWEISNGVRSVIDIIAERRGVDEVEARAIYQKNLADKAARVQAAPMTFNLGAEPDDDEEPVSPAGTVAN